MTVVAPTIISNGSPIDETYPLLSIDVYSEVNRIPTARIVLKDGNLAQQQFKISDTDTFLPGTEVEIKLGYQDNSSSGKTVFKGVVVGHSIEATVEGPRLTIDLKHKALKLAVTRKSVVHEDTSDGDIIETIIGDAGLKSESVALKDFKHPQLVQYYCTDWDFILSRADASGHLVVVKNEVIAVSEIKLDGDAKETFDYVISEIYSLEMEADALDQFSAVESVAWDFKEQKATEPAAGKNLSLAQGNLDGEAIAGKIAAGKAGCLSPVPLEEKELESWSNAILARSRLSLIRGRICTGGRTDIALLDMIEISGMGKRFNGNALVTGIRHRVDAQHGWQTDLQLGLSAERFAARPGILDAPAAGLLPGVHGLQIGIVQAYEEDPKKEFRVKVKLVGFAEKNMVWARVASPDAGKSHGFFSRPIEGDEVIIGFFNDDPRQPVILGALYGSKNTPPEVSQFTKETAGKGIVTEKATVLLDDEKEAIEISDKHGNSIVMDKEGIVIKSAKDLTITTEGKVEIKGKDGKGALTIDKSGNVEIKGDKVDVK